ncbi:hypothetical protein PQE20_10880 [Vibrio harveyi]|uniref:hypothetical protein n=1 Tax=Vibrio harveyi TaxID=669 RepID=UPI00069F13BC|nr:hypothetical protein [Vibrio harveyi]EKO3831343.1 hypothetical protein [Vibrio harveyi]KNY43681.1 hypothetical protein AKG93_10060 [Vibrio harveyi]MCG9549935.1 hypothetical protein [Vibrio harveyi]WCP79328.1 hypothetical protein PQE20_10880 [Vibrio harveyi]HDM8052206.1 hypothetical protein [Vibrio harveyi]
MKKKYWIASALSTCLMALYWLTDEQTTAAAANIQPANNNEEKRNTPHGERTSLIEVKQALTASALERSNELAFEKALESTLSDRPDQVEDALGALEANYSQNLTITYISESAHDDATENGKPIINLAVEQQLQTIIYSWELTQNNPINYSLGLEQLFEDPEGDLLTTRIWLENANGLSVLNQGQIMLQGAPKDFNQTTYLAVSARDDHHGTEDHAWVTTRFELPAVTAEQNDTEHPLIDGVVYRLETTTLLGGRKYPYEVVYCEAFKFIDDEVFYAASNNKTRCPDEHKLNKVGEYQISDDSLIIHIKGSRQIWTTKKTYLSRVHKDTENYFITVFNNNRFESYTMQKNKRSMEERLNVNTGKELYQSALFDLLIPTAGGYRHALAGNYIFDRRHAQGGEYYDGFDSDLNIVTSNSDLFAHEFCQFWDTSILAGEGMFSEVISYSNNTDCATAPKPSAYAYVYFNNDYHANDEFIQGEVYSYILRPFPQYASKVEELKINMIYHYPKNTAAYK